MIACSDKVSAVSPERGGAPRQARGQRVRPASLAGRETLRPETIGAGGSGAGHAYSIESITERLEEAGATLLCLPASGPRTDIRTSKWPAIHAAIDAYGWSGARLRPAVPAAAAITRMDEALSWIRLIPEENYVLRRIVGARAMVSPLTGRHLFSWRRLGGLLGADARAVRRWHAKGIAIILSHLSAGAAP